MPSLKRKAIYIQSFRVHKAFNCDHEFLKQIIFSRNIYLYLQSAVDPQKWSTHLEAKKKNSTVNHIILCNILYYRRGTMTQLPPFLNNAASPQNKYLAEQRKKTIQFRFQISDSVFFNNFQRQIYKRFFKALFQNSIDNHWTHTRIFFIL